MDAGLDSLAAAELGRAIGDELDTQLSSTLLFDHPTRDALVSHLTLKVVPPPNVMNNESAPTAGISRTTATVDRLIRQLVGPQVAPDAPLLDAGLDSLAAAELGRVIGEELDTQLSSTLLFDHPTRDALVSHLNHEAAPPSIFTSAESAHKVDASRTGLSCRIPRSVTALSQLMSLTRMRSMKQARCL